MYFVNQGLQSPGIVPHLRCHKVVRSLIDGSMKMRHEEQKEKKESSLQLPLDMMMFNAQCSIFNENRSEVTPNLRYQQEKNERICLSCLKVTENIAIFVVELCRKLQILSFGWHVFATAKAMVYTVLSPSVSSRMSSRRTIPIMPIGSWTVSCLSICG